MKRLSSVLVALAFGGSLAIGTGAWGAQAQSTGSGPDQSPTALVGTVNAYALTGNPNAVVLTPKNAGVILTPKNASTILTRTPNAAIPLNGSWSAMNNGLSNKCLDAADDSRQNPDQNGDYVQIWSCTGHVNQGWAFVGVEGIWWKTENEYGNHLVLDAENDRYDNPWSNGDKVQMWTYNGHCQQLWAIYLVPNNANFWLVNQCTAEKVLDAENDSIDNPFNNGDYIQLWDNLGTNGLTHLNQQWY